MTKPATYRTILAAAIRSSRVYLRGALYMPTREAARTVAGFACLALDVPFAARTHDCERAYTRALARAQASYARW